MKNSNLLAANEIEIIEGARVFRTHENCRHSGEYRVDRVLDGDLVKLVKLNGNKANYNLAYANELRVLVR